MFYKGGYNWSQPMFAYGLEFNWKNMIFIYLLLTSYFLLFK
jgi:hypothetical protein